MSDKVDIFFPLYIGDYIRDTVDLSLEEDCVYLRLLMALWSRDGWLPLDHDRLARHVRVDRGTWDRIWPTIGRFFTVADARVTQKRLTAELEKARSLKEAAVNRARKAGLASAAVRLNTGFNLEPSPKSTILPSPSESPSEKPSPKPDNAHARVLAEFSRLWKGKHRAEYIPTAADKSQLGRLLRELGAEQVDGLQPAFVAYLADTDAFVEKQGHSLRFFCAAGGFNKYRGQRPAAGLRVGHARVDEPRNYGKGDQEL